MGTADIVQSIAINISIIAIIITIIDNRQYTRFMNPNHVFIFFKLNSHLKIIKNIINNKPCPTTKYA